MSRFFLINLKVLELTLLVDEDCAKSTPRHIFMSLFSFSLFCIFYKYKNINIICSFNKLDRFTFTFLTFDWYLYLPKLIKVKGLAQGSKSFNQALLSFDPASFRLPVLFLIYTIYVISTDYDWCTGALQIHKYEQRRRTCLTDTLLDDMKINKNKIKIVPIYWIWDSKLV